MQEKKGFINNWQKANGNGQTALSAASGISKIIDFFDHDYGNFEKCNMQFANGNRSLKLRLGFNVMSVGFFFCCLIVLASCNAPYVSKKRGYYHIDLPKRGYQKFEKAGFPYSFEYPVYAQIVQDSTFFDTNPENPYWINIDFPQFKGRVFLSYKIIGGKALYRVKQPDGKYKDSLGTNVFDRMVADAFTLTNKNDVVSTSIKDSFIHTGNNISGVFFKVGGNAATAKQFFLSDTTKNFIRGALYFDVTPNADSLKPVQDFLQTDLEHIINTFQWKK